MFSSTDVGFHDVFGNVWEWTEDHFNGLPGYASDAFYDDFSSPCFDGRHNVILVQIIFIYKKMLGFLDEFLSNFKIIYNLVQIYLFSIPKSGRILGIDW